MWHLHWHWLNQESVGSNSVSCDDPDAYLNGLAYADVVKREVIKTDDLMVYVVTAPANSYHSEAHGWWIFIRQKKGA